MRVEADHAAHRQQRQARAGHGHAPAHRHHQARAHAGDGELHADAHEHAAVRLRVRRDDGQGAAADSQDARHRRRPARRAGDRDGAVVRRRHGHRSRPIGNAANAQGRRRQMERRRRADRFPTGTYIVRAGQPYGLAAFYSARTGERGRVHAVELLRQHRGGSRRLPGSFGSRSRRPSAHTPFATDVSLIAALPLESAARLPLRSEQQTRQEVRHRASSPAKRSTKRSRRFAR